jgi:cytoskeletal protein CcmA (bactofilin family)
MAVGRISGPLLKANLIRNGIDLAFETDLLYLDVSNNRIGIRKGNPQHELDVNGTTQVIDLIVTNRADIADVTIENNTISTTNPYLNLATLDTVVSLNKLRIDSIDIEGNAITTNASNANLELRPNGTGSVDIHSNLNVDGNVYVTGNITADGTINLGDADTDNVVFNAEVASDIIPDITNTYSLGSDPTTGGKEWNNVWVNNLIASSINSNALDVGGVDLTLRQGNIWYVAANGDDIKSGDHIQDPYASVGKALSVAQPGDTVYIFPGEYEETFPLTVPAGVTVLGQGIRAVSIVPTLATNTNDAFLLNGETTVENLTVKDFFYDSVNNTGHAFRFAPNFTVTSRSPYLKNITVITQGSTTSALDPRGFDTGDAGRGAYFDGSVATTSSIEASILFQSVTFITPGVDAITLTNGVRVEWLNSFTYFADRSIFAFDGTAGLYNTGKTRIRLGGVSGTFSAGDTVTFTSTDASTVVNLSVDSVEGDTLLIDGKDEQLVGFDTTPASISNGSGATATSIENFDLKDFGAEVRLIGSASVYGNFGLVGDGAGVLMYAIGHNMAYIGTGKEFTNEAEAVIQANEVVETNSAKIRYNTVDHKGDFRVGNLFYVNQESGTVDFAVTAFTINTTGGVTFVTNGDTTFIDGTKVETGDWRISGNTIETLTQDANFNSASGEINLNANVNLTGDLDVTGNVTVGGNITIGDEATDTIQIVAGIDSDIVPSLDSVYSLGTPTKQWSNLWVNEINVDGIQIRDNYIESTESNADLELRANGTGEILIPSNDVQINNNLTVNGTTTLNDVNINGTLTLSGTLTQSEDINIAGNLTVDQTLTVGAAAQFEEILIDDNYITTTSSNSDLELRANGTGEILIPNNDLNITNDLTVGGDIDANNLTITGQITSDSFTTGDIVIDNNLIQTTLAGSDLELRANGNGEITVPGNDVVLGQDLTVSRDTDLQSVDITGTVSHTGNVVQVGNINLSGNYTISGLVSVDSAAQFENIKIDDNVITTTDSNSDLELRANGTGEILIPNNDLNITNDLRVDGTISVGDITSLGTITANRFSTGDILIDDNFITTTQSNSDLELRANGTGEVAVPTNDVVLGQNLTVNGTTDLTDTNIVGDVVHIGDTVQTGNVSQTGNLSVDGNVTISSTAQFEDIQINGNVLTTTLSNSNLELRANGTGVVLIPNNNVTISNALTVGGTLAVNDVVSTGTIQANNFTTGDILIDDNYITTTTSNSDLELRANGTGSIIIDNFDINQSTISSSTDIILDPGSENVIIDSTGALRLPVGTTGERPTPATGQVRFNSTLGRFEGYNGTNWIQLSGVVDLDGDTRVTAELTEGANDNVIRFDIAGSTIVDIDATRLNAPQIVVDNITIDGNVISTTTDTNLVLNPQGTGSVVIDNFSIKDNTITNTVSNSVTAFNNTGGGRVKIAGTYGMVIPVGTNTNRPPIGFTEVGQMRFNTESSRVEIYDGANWVSVAGSQSGISRAEAEDIAFEIVLSLG